jgi:hypothetical protein
MWRLHGRGYFVGCITKYVERYHLKNGVQDLEKAKHFLEKLIELENSDVGRRNVDVLLEMARASLTNYQQCLEKHPHVESMGTEVKATGWVGYTFEGSDSEGFLYTCANCHGKFRTPANENPNSFHACVFAGT